MTNKLFLTIHSIIYTVFALVLFFFPEQIWPIYGVDINDKYAYFLSQHTSIFLGGIAAFTYLLRKTNHQLTEVQLLKALITTNTIGLIITLYAGFTNIFTGFGWSDPIFFFILTLASSYQLKKSRN